jgi:hypothetical protein
MIMVSQTLSVKKNTSKPTSVKMGVKIGEVEFDISNISQADMEKLKKMLPDLQQSWKLSQLDIILEAIQYIRTLQNNLTG